MRVALRPWGRVAAAACCLAAGAAVSAPTTSFDDFPGVSATLDIAEGSCPSPIPLTVQADKAADIKHGSRVLAKVMAWAQINTQMTCPQASAIEVTGLVNGVAVYNGLARRAFQWALVEGRVAPRPAAAAAASTQPAELALCDKLGSLAEDPESVTFGVTDQALDAAKLIPACEAAVKVDASSPRLRFQLARGYLKAERFEDAIEHLLAAAEAGHGGAMAYLADIHLHGGPGIEVDPLLARTLYQKAVASGFEPAAKILLEFEDRTDDHMAAEASDNPGAVASGSPKPYLVPGVVDSILNRRFDDIEYNESWVKDYLFNIADNIAAICESNFTKQELATLKAQANTDHFGMQQATAGGHLLSALFLMANVVKNQGAIGPQEGALNEDPFEAGMKDTEALFSRHLCGAPELTRFSDNLKAFVNNAEAPLPGFNELKNACLMHTPPSKYKPSDFCMCFASGLSQARVSQANRRALQKNFRETSVKLMDMKRNRAYFQGCRTGF